MFILYDVEFYCFKLILNAPEFLINETKVKLYGRIAEIKWDLGDVETLRVSKMANCVCGDRLESIGYRCMSVSPAHGRHI